MKSYLRGKNLNCQFNQSQYFCTFTRNNINEVISMTCVLLITQNFPNI